MRRPRLQFVASFLFPFALSFCAMGDEYSRIAVTPSNITLEGKDSSMQLLVTGYDADENPTDLTHLAQYSLDSAIASVSSTGVIRSQQDGTSVVTVLFADHEVNVPVTTSHTHARITLNFENDI